MSADMLKSLNSKTREIIKTYWGGMNFVGEDELGPLIEAANAQEAFAEDSEPESSKSGSGSQAQAAQG